MYAIILLMDNQNVTKTETPTPTVDEVVTYDTLDAAKKTLVDYRALNGLVSTDDSGTGIRKMPMEELALLLQVTRKTLYDWQNTIPDFWVMVNNRRAQISPQSRLAMVEETWYLKARKGEWQHLNAWLLNYKPGYKTPGIKVEHEMGETLADLFRKVEQQQPKVIDAEVTQSATEQQPNA